MATLRGFQSNTTIHAAFWIYKPDPTIAPPPKETFVEVNAIQRIEATSEVVLTAVTNVQVVGNVLTVTVAAIGALRSGQSVVFRGLTNATFLNGNFATVNQISGTTFTASYTNPNYGPASEPAGAQLLDTTSRMCEIYYPETGISTSQAPRKLVGIEASLFIYDMEALFS